MEQKDFEYERKICKKNKRQQVITKRIEIMLLIINIILFIVYFAMGKSETALFVMTQIIAIIIVMVADKKLFQ